MSPISNSNEQRKGDVSLLEKSNIEIPVWQKVNLTIKEASALFGVGENRIRQITDDEDCPFVLWVGTKRLIKRKLFESYIEKQYSI